MQVMKVSLRECKKQPLKNTFTSHFSFTIQKSNAHPLFFQTSRHYLSPLSSFSKQKTIFQTHISNFCANFSKTSHQKLGNIKASNFHKISQRRNSNLVNREHSSSNIDFKLREQEEEREREREEENKDDTISLELIAETYRHYKDYERYEYIWSLPGGSFLIDRTIFLIITLYIIISLYESYEQQIYLNTLEFSKEIEHRELTEKKIELSKKDEVIVPFDYPYERSPQTLLLFSTIFSYGVGYTYGFLRTMWKYTNFAKYSGKPQYNTKKLRNIISSKGGRRVASTAAFACFLHLVVDYVRRYVEDERRLNRYEITQIMELFSAKEENRMVIASKDSRKQLSDIINQMVSDVYKYNVVNYSIYAFSLYFGPFVIFPQVLSIYLTNLSLFWPLHKDETIVTKQFKIFFDIYYYSNDNLLFKLTNIMREIPDDSPQVAKEKSRLMLKKEREQRKVLENQKSSIQQIQINNDGIAAQASDRPNSEK